MDFDTLAIHGGYRSDDTHSSSVPVHRTSAYHFDDTNHAADLFALKQLGNIYTRLMNPTQNVLETRMAALEGGVASVALSSGTAAIHYSVLNICRQGDEIVSANNLYGGTYTMFDSILPDYGIRTTFVDINNAEEIESAIHEKTRLIFAEVIGNPVLDMANIGMLSKIAKKHSLPLVIDSTLTPPCIFKPIEHGANVVIHSLSKWIGGHGTAIGGIAIDGGNFDWSNEKFKNFNEPDSSYHGLRYAKDLGDLTPLCFALRMRLVPLRNLGSCISPDNAWLFLQGIETLSLRMERHNENALKVAKHLENHDQVSWVRYPGLEKDPSYQNAVSQLKNGFGGMVVFGIKGGSEQGAAFIDRLKLFCHLANVGDAKSLAIHPASTTHSQLDEKQQRAGGITPDLIRLSIGIESIEDIIADIDLALSQ